MRPLAMRALAMRPLAILDFRLFDLDLTHCALLQKPPLFCAVGQYAVVIRCVAMFGSIIFGSELICLQCVAFVMMHVASPYQPSLLLSMALSYQTSAFEVAIAYLLSTITPPDPCHLLKCLLSLI
jgi:hypothetical protein